MSSISGFCTPVVAVDSQERQGALPAVQLTILVGLQAAVDDQPIDVASVLAGLSTNLRGRGTFQIQLDGALASHEAPALSGGQRVRVNLNPCANINLPRVGTVDRSTGRTRANSACPGHAHLRVAISSFKFSYNDDYGDADQFAAPGTRHACVKASNRSPERP